MRGNVGKSLYCGFCRKEWMRQGKQAWDWLVWIMSVGSEAQDCPSYLALVPGVIRAGEWWARCGNLTGVGGSGLQGAWLTISRSRLAWDRQAPQVRKTPDVREQNEKICLMHEHTFSK